MGSSPDEANNPENEILQFNLQKNSADNYKKNAEMQNVKTRMRELGYEPDAQKGKGGNNQRRGGANEKAWRIIELAKTGDMDALMAH